jgi:hypothetical protein
MDSMPQILAYFSPETMLPLSSLLATVVGFALLIKRSSIRFAVHCCRSAFRKLPGRSAVEAPHFAAKVREAKRKAPRR